MERMIAFEDGNLLLEVVKDGNYLHETWRGSTLKGKAEELFDQIGKVLRKYNLDGVLLDAREHRGLSPETQEYAVKTIGTYAKLHGKFKEAIIMPKDVFSAFSVENYSKKVAKDGPIQVKFFDSIEKADEWMRSE